MPITGKCFFMESGAAEDDTAYVTKGFSWLIQNEEALLVMYVPTKEQIRNTYLGKAIGRDDLATEFENNGIIRFGENDIHVITNDLEELQDTIRLFALWCDDNSLKEMESKYSISDILVFPWVPSYDITKWKEEKNPTKITL